MRHRLLASISAGALVLSALAFGSTTAQADDTTSISGTVTLPAGHSFTGASTVHALVFGDGLSLEEVTGTVNTNGSYTISDVAPDTPYAVYVVPDGMDPNDLLITFYGGYATSASDLLNFTLPSGLATVSVPSGSQGMTGVNITMAQGSYIRGTLLAQDGAPISAADASGSSVMCNGSGHSTVSVKADGTYSCLVVPGQTYTISASVPGYMPTWYGGFVGTVPSATDNVAGVTAVAAGQIADNFNITMVSLTGTATAATGGVADTSNHGSLLILAGMLIVAGLAIQRLYVRVKP